MKNIKFDKQLLFGILIGFFSGIAISLAAYSRIAPSSQTIKDFLNKHYSDYPIGQYKKELFSAIDNNYLLAFYENTEGSFTAAIFETEGSDWEENFRSISATLTLPGKSGELSFPTHCSTIKDKNNTNLEELAWGFFYNPSVKSVEVNGGKAAVIELNGMDNLKLWYKVVEWEKNGSINFLDKNNKTIKSYPNGAIQGK